MAFPEDWRGQGEIGLDPPVGIAEREEPLRGGREVEIGRHSFISGGGKTDASVAGAFSIAYSIFGGSDVGGSGVAGVLGEDRGDGGEVRAGGI